MAEVLNQDSYIPSVLIQQSWERSHKYGVNPYVFSTHTHISEEDLQQRLLLKALLIETAIPYADHLFDLIKSTFILTLFDQDGVILLSRGDRLPESMLKQHTTPGNVWSEEIMGTTALGLSLITGEPIHMVGDEHYIALLKENTCASALIRDEEGSIIGGVAVSAHLSEHSPYLLGMIKSTAMAIETAYHLKKDQSRVERILGKLSNSPSQMVVIAAPCGNVIFANEASQAMFNFEEGLKINSLFAGHSAISRTMVEQRNFIGYQEVYEEKHISWDTYWMKDEVFPNGVMLAIGRDITRNIQMQDAIKEHNRLKTMGMFSAQMAHEIRNPLATLSIAISLIKTKLKQQQYELAEERIGLIQSEIQRISHLADHFLSISKPSTPIKGLHSLKTTIQELSLLLESKFAKANVEYKQICLTDSLASFDPDQIRQVLLNMLFNALDATPSDGKIEVLLGENDHLFKIEIVDNGEGIPDDRLQDIFEPFYTTKSKGIGLGLSNSKAIMEAHGGTLEIFPLEQGTRVLLTLPKEN